MCIRDSIYHDRRIRPAGIYEWYSGSDFLRSGVCCYGWFNGLLFHWNHVTACTLQISLQHTGDQAFLFQPENKQFDQGAYAGPIL